MKPQTSLQLEKLVKTRKGRTYGIYKNRYNQYVIERLDSKGYLLKSQPLWGYSCDSIEEAEQIIKEKGDMLKRRRVTYEYY